MKKLGSAAVLGALALALSAGVFFARKAEIVRAVEYKTLDWRFRHFSDPKKHDPGIVLVMLDQASLDHFEGDQVYWPWPRSIYGAALDFLKAAGAKAVVFDLLFTSPSPYAVSEDQTFGDSLKRFGNTALAMQLSPEPDVHRSAPPPPAFALNVAGDASGAALPRLSARVPVAQILPGARYLGDTSSLPDSDGVFRDISLLSEMDGKYYPSLALAGVLAASGGGAHIQADKNALTLAGIRVPLTDGKLLLRFHGAALAPDLAPGQKTYEAYPLGNLILSWENIQEGKKAPLDPALFKDKLVFIGASAAGLLDNRPSPVAQVFPGTEIIATAVDNILNRDFLLPASAGVSFLLILAAVFLTVASTRLIRSAAAASAAAAALCVLLAVAAILCFQRGLWLDMAAPQLGLWLAFAATSAYGYAVEGRQKRYIQSAFSRYLSSDIVDQIADDPSKLALGGERREVTVYFSDVEGFTTISEGLTPERLTFLMNRYLGEMTENVLRSGGTLDKYIGDAIMAFWGAPLPRADHALAACRVALENQARLIALQEEFARQGFPPIRARIGLNSGPATIGNMGSARRFSYTAMGDNVNLASRLEGANKGYGTYIMISESTKAAAGDAVETRPLDFVKVKGKTMPIGVYELLGLKGATDGALLRKARRFEEGLAHYRARRWDEAVAAFASLLGDLGPDPASALYIERCAHYKESPPPPDWDGSYTLTEK